MKFRFYDIPCFGYPIQNAIHDAILKILGDGAKEFLDLGMDTFIQKKISGGKLKPLITELYKRDLVAAANQIQKVQDSLIELNPNSIKSMEDWKGFIHGCGIEPGWENHLHYDNILKIFGIHDPVLINQILNTEITKNDDEKVHNARRPGALALQSIVYFQSERLHD